MTSRESLPMNGAGDAANNKEEQKQSLRDIEEFEKRVGYHDTDTDSD